MLLMESSNSTWNMKHDILSAKFEICDRSTRNCSGLSSGISGFVFRCSLISASSSEVAL